VILNTGRFDATINFPEECVSAWYELQGGYVVPTQFADSLRQLLAESERHEVERRIAKSRKKRKKK
jgi:hypothetical protein